MKKTKYLLVATMAVMLCLMCLMTTTFSWFLRPANQGGSLTWNGSYNVSDGSDITMNTYEVTEKPSGLEKGEQAVTSFANTTGLTKGNRKYYCTDIKNTGSVDQSVSLYLSGYEVTAGDKNKAYLGVNKPLKTYKNLSGSSVTYTMATHSSAGSIGNSNNYRIYFNLNGKWSGNTSFSVYYNETDTNIEDLTATEFNKVLTLDSETGYYYAEISSNTKKMCIAVTDTTNKELRTITLAVGSDVVFSALEPTLVTLANQEGEFWKINSSLISITALFQYYDTITMTKGSTFTLNLQNGVHYSGDSITYTISENQQIASLDENNVLTAQNVGETTLQITVAGSSGDPITVETKVKVIDTSTNDISIVTNCFVPKTTDASKPSIVSVYWYINNEGDETLKYTIEDVYLSL